MRTTSKYIFLSASVVMMMLAGCGNRENEPQMNSSKATPSFTATIAHSRAFDQSWEQGDEIGISGCGRSNVCYVTPEGDGSFSVKTPGDQIYFQNESETEFTAYYPWNNIADGTEKIKSDTQNQTQQKSFDFLWAKASGQKDAPSVLFRFSHMMSRLSLTVKPGDGMSFDEVKAASLSLGGFIHTGSFNTADGTAVADVGVATDKWVFTGGVAPVSINETDKTATYSLLFFPQVFSEPLPFQAELNLVGNDSYHLRAQIDLTSANREKDGTDAKNELVAGRQYNLSLTLHKTDITISQCVINPWTDVTGDDIIVD